MLNHITLELYFIKIINDESRFILSFTNNYKLNKKIIINILVNISYLYI